MFDHWRIHGDQSPNNCDSVGTVFVLQCQDALFYFIFLYVESLGEQLHPCMFFCVCFFNDVVPLLFLFCFVHVPVPCMQ